MGPWPTCILGEALGGICVPPCTKTKCFCLCISRAELPSSISPLSAAVPLRGRLAVSRNLSPREVAGEGVCDAQSPSPHPSPQHSYSEMGFKACVRAGMSKPISLSWYKIHRPEKGQFKGFRGQMFPAAGSGGGGSMRLFPFAPFSMEFIKTGTPFPFLAPHPSA